MNKKQVFSIVNEIHLFFKITLKLDKINNMKTFFYYFIALTVHCMAKKNTLIFR